MRFRSLAFSLFGFTTLVACTPQTINSVSVRTDGYDWITTDPALGDIASVGHVTKVREGDLLHVQVEINNLTNKRQGIHYQFIWMDQAGIVLHSSFGWVDEWIDGRQTLTLNGVAPDNRATACRLELKRFVQ